MNNDGYGLKQNDDFISSSLDKILKDVTESSFCNQEFILRLSVSDSVNPECRSSDSGFYM